MFHYKPSILGYPIYGNPPYVWGWSHEASCKEMHCLFRHVLLASFSVQVCSSLRNDLEEFFVGTRWNYCIYKDINICFLTWQHALIFFPGKENQRHPAVFRWCFFRIAADEIIQLFIASRAQKESPEISKNGGTRRSLLGGLEHEFDFSIYWECHNPNWRTHIFQDDKIVKTTNQIISECFCHLPLRQRTFLDDLATSPSQEW